MITVIRTSPTRTKYCGRTVDNLIASNDGEAHQIIIVASNKSPNENGLDALRAGIGASAGKPFIFLEDDLAFIRHFNRAAEAFTQAASGVPSLILPLCAAYSDALNKCRGIAWRYPVEKFYGTQAFVIDPADARRFLDWTAGQKLPSQGFDLLLKQWALENKQTHFLTPQRCFVQHVGVESSLHRGRFHHYAAWPGPDFQWRTGAYSLAEQKNRPCDKPLAAAIAAWFGPKSIAYDLGCSTGNYLKELHAAGIPAKGFEATPGIEGPDITELDLARPQLFAEKPGNVMCLEVAEHIHPEDEPHFLANIATLCRQKLVLSWAIPRQGGKRHVNEAAADYVLQQLRPHGFIVDARKGQELRDAATIKWFKNSLYAFTRKEQA